VEGEREHDHIYTSTHSFPLDYGGEREDESGGQAIYENWIGSQCLPPGKRHWKIDLRK
jgi:hypothetical protein